MKGVADEIINSVILEFYKMAQVMPVDQLQDSILRLMRKLIDFDSGCIVKTRVDSHNKINIVSGFGYHANDELIQLRRELIGDEYMKDGVVHSNDPLLVKAVRNFNKSCVLSFSEINHEGAREYAIKSGVKNAMSMVSFLSGKDMSLVALARGSKGSEFSAIEACVSDILVPHINQAVKINAALSKSFFSRLAQDAAIVIANQCGDIFYIDDVSVHFIEKEFGDWTGKNIPATILNGNGFYMGKSINARIKRQGDLVYVVVEPRPIGATLTKAELRVVEAIVKHGTYKEAAKILMVSPSTIRNQLHRIYQKLGVSSKSDLSKSFLS
jgi:DNA-binding CsgD family transcriptional regulator